MFKPRKKARRATSIAQIQETYRDHPYMLRVNTLKEQLKQEKLQEKIFCQSNKKKKATD